MSILRVALVLSNWGFCTHDRRLRHRRLRLVVAIRHPVCGGACPGGATGPARRAGTVRCDPSRFPDCDLAVCVVGGADLCARAPQRRGPGTGGACTDVCDLGYGAGRAGDDPEAPSGRGPSVELRSGGKLAAVVFFCGLAYAFYYLVFGGITYQFFTKVYYPGAAAQVAKLGVWFWPIEMAVAY